MVELVNPVTGHQIKTEDESVKFWQSSGYRVVELEPNKAPAKKAAPKKSSK